MTDSESSRQVVHMFDHTLPTAVRHVLTNLHPDLHYHPLGLTAGASTRHWRRHDHSNKFAEGADFFVSLPDAMGAFAEGGVVDVLKLDCEGCGERCSDPLMAAAALQLHYSGTHLTAAFTHR